jgi:hypothetical protein
VGLRKGVKKINRITGQTEKGGEENKQNDRRD